MAYQEFDGELDAPAYTEFNGKLDAPKSRTWGEAISDTGSAIASGVASVGDELGRLRDEFFTGVDNTSAALSTVGVAAQASQLQKMQDKLAELERTGLGETPEAQGLRKTAQHYAKRFPSMINGMTEAQAAAQLGSKMTTRPAVAAVGEAKSFGEAWDIFKKNPYDVIAGVTATSIPSMLPALVTGAVLGPAAGAAAMGGSSAIAEAGGSLADFARDKGINTTDPKAVEAFFSDRKNLSDAMSYAGKRAGIIGALDVASGGIAGKTLAPTFKSAIARQAVNMPSQMAIQASLGAGGEAGGQLATKGRIDQPGQVLMEAVGELAGAPMEVAAFSKDAFKSATAPKAITPEVVAAAITSPEVTSVDQAIEASQAALASPVRDAVDASFGIIGSQANRIAPLSESEANGQRYAAELDRRRAASQAELNDLVAMEQADKATRVDGLLADQNEFNDLVSSETRSKQAMLGQMDQERARQASIDAAYESKPTADAVHRASVDEAPNAMSAAFNRLADKTIGPDPVAEVPAVPALKPEAQPRIVPRFDGAVTMPLELAQLQVEMDGGEVVRVANRNGKYGYAVLKEKQASPQAQQASAAIETIASKQQKLDGIDPFSEDHANALESLHALVLKDAEKSITSGEMPVYSNGNGNYVAISPSAQNKGKFQVTRYSKSGIMGDSQYNSIEQAVQQEGLASTPRVGVDEANMVIGSSIEAEADFQDKKQPAKPTDPRLIAKSTQSIDPEHLGRNSKPLAEGGKPFKTKDEAATAKKLQPMLRVIKTKGGFALAPKTEKQIAAQEAAARRLSIARTGTAGVPTAAHEFIAGEGGMDASTKNEFGFGNNPRVGNRTLFAGARGGMSIESATQKLIESRYLPQGATHSDTVALINRSFTKPQYTVDGTEVAAQAEVEARFDDYLAAQEEAATDDGFDSFGSFESVPDEFTLDDADWAGYDALEDPIKLEVNALLAQADALGIDTDTIKEDADDDTRNGSEQDYYESARTALTTAIEASNRSSSQNAGTPGNAGIQAEGLTPPAQEGSAESVEKFGEFNPAKLKPDRPGVFLLEEGEYQRFEGIWFRGEKTPQATLKTEMPSGASSPKDRFPHQRWMRVADFSQNAWGDPKALTNRAKYLPKQAAQSEGLTAPTRAEVEAQQERADNAARTETAQRKAQDMADKQDRERKDIAARSEAAADTFVLGGDAEQNLSGQGSIFDEPAKESTPQRSQPTYGEKFTIDMGYMLGVVPFRANAPVKVPDGSTVLSTEIMQRKVDISRAEAAIYPLFDHKTHWRISAVKSEDGEIYSKVEVMNENYGRTPEGEVVAYFEELRGHDADALQRLAPAVHKVAIKAYEAAKSASEPSMFDEPVQPADQATAILDAANVTGKERIDALKDVKKGDITPDELKAAYPAKIEDIGEKIGGARKDTAVSTGARVAAPKAQDDRSTWAKRFSIAQIAGGFDISVNGQDVAGKWTISDTRNKDRFDQPKKMGGYFDSKEEAEAALPLIAVAQKHRVTTAREYSADGTLAYEIWRDINDRKRVKVVDRQFETRIAAMEYMAKNAQSILETSTTFGEADLPKPESTNRIGVERRTDNVKGEDFQEAFGFRGIEFGNWNNQDERQEVMNAAYDGLIDLAEVLGVPPKAIGLNGDLALAFGARGQGLSSARAHYERNRAVINLTKMNGAGALAHEWFHALDHYFGRQDGKASAEWKINADGTRSFDVKGAEDDMASGGFRIRNSGVREELRDAYSKLVKSLFYKAEQYVDDTAKADKFVATTRGELDERLQALRKDLSEQKDIRYYKRNNKPASAEQLAEFDALAAEFVEGRGLETEWKSFPGKTRMSIQSRHTNDALEKMSAIYKAVRGRSGFDSTNHNGALDTVRQYITRYEQRLKLLADANNSTSKTKNVPTSFAMDAKSLDQGRGGDYWTTPHEMVARAFQGYVEDMISAKDGKSPFLNYAPENAGILTPWGVKRPYPSGQERKAMNAEFDNFIGAIQTKETGQGVAMFSRTKQSDIASAWQMLASNEQAFTYPASTEETMDGILADIGEQLKVVDEPGGVGKDVAKAWRAYPLDANGQPEMSKPAYIIHYKDGKIELNVEKFNEGDYGSYLYALVGAYAHNNKLKFEGDRFGISEAGMERRLENMISLALKYGSTDFIAPHPDQLKQFNMEWKEGDSAFNLEQMLMASYNSISKKFPSIKDYVYDFDSSAITNKQSGVALDDEGRKELGEEARDAGVRAGKRTIARAVFTNTIDSEATGEGRRELLGRINSWTRGTLDSTYVKALYSRTGTSGQSVTETKAQVARVTAKQVNGPRTVVVAAPEDLPVDAPSDARGLYYKGVVYVVASNNANFSEVASTLAHETIAHYGLRTMLGSVGWKQLMANISLAVKSGNKPMKALSEQIKRTYVDENGKFNLNDNQHADELAAATVEAALDENGEFKPGFGFLKSVFAKIAQFLRDQGIDIKFTNAELQGMLVLSMRNLESGEKTLGGGSVAVAASRGGRGIINGLMPIDPHDGGGAFARATSVITGLASPQAWQAPDMSKMDDVIYSMQDKHIDTRRITQAVRAAIGTIGDNINPYMQEELYHGRSAMATKEFLEQQIRPMMIDMQARKVDMSDFEEYLHNRHAQRRNEQVAKINPKMPDGGSGIKTADAAAYLAGLTPEKARAYKALAVHVDNINRSTRALLVSSGLEKQSTIDAWQAAYGDEYVPLMREEMDDGVMGIGQGFSVRGGSSKRAMGSDKPVANIIANIALQREKAITRSEKQRIGHALYGMVLKAPNDDFWFSVDPALQNVKTPNQIMATQIQLISLGLDPVDAESIAKEPTTRYINPQTGLVSSRINPALRSAANVLAVRIDGEDKYVFFNAKDARSMRMAKSLKNLDSDQLGVVMGTVAKMTRYFSAINTQYNPIFGVTNIARDVQTAMLNLESTALKGKKAEVMKHILPALRGIYTDLRDHRAGKAATSSYAQIFEEFQREGGATGYRDMYANAQERADAIKDELADINAGKLKQLGKGVMGWLSDYNESMENSVRVSAYKVGLEQGMSKQQAASLAKNLTVNFNRKGQVALQAGALYAFFNASVQGTARIAETMFEGGKLSVLGKKILTGGLLLGSMQALLLAAAGFDDDEPPDFVRERNLIIPLGDKKYVSIPMPLGYHVLPNIARIPTEWAMGGFKDTPKRIGQMVGLFADAFNPIGSAGLSLQTLTPTIIDPLAALSENRDFTGKPIARKDFDPMHPSAGHTRAKDSATPWSKVISEAVNFMTGGTDYKPGLVSPTPDQIDYIIGQVTGGVGREAGKVAQVIGGGISGEEVPLYKIPLVGRFVGTTEGQAAEAGRFYDNLRSIGEHKVEVDGLRHDRKGADAVQYQRENPEAMLAPMATKLQGEISKLTKLKRELLKNDASKERVKMIDMQITSRMALLNQRVKQMRSAEVAN